MTAIIASLAIGIVFITLFAVLFHDTTSSVYSSNHEPSDSQVQLRDIEDVYSGMERTDNNTVVTIGSQQYYMATLSGMNIFSIPRGTTITFQGVTFSFPYGSLLTPAFGGTVFVIKYPDGNVERFGQVTETNGGGGSAQCALCVSSLPNAKVPMADTVLGNHQNPNAGVAIYNHGEQIKLLVSKG